MLLIIELSIELNIKLNIERNIKKENNLVFINPETNGHPINFL
jgi:hypothetical protein